MSDPGKPRYYYGGKELHGVDSVTINGIELLHPTGLTIEPEGHARPLAGFGRTMMTYEVRFKCVSWGRARPSVPACQRGIG